MSYGFSAGEIDEAFSQIEADHSMTVRCKVVVETANAPTTQRAEQFLLERGVEVLPVILWNSSGVTVS